MKTHYIDKAAVRGILDGLGGQFVTVSAIKKNGLPTKHNGKLSDSPPSHGQHDKLFTIKKSDNTGYRSFSDNQVTRIAGGGKVYAIKSELDKLMTG